MSKVLIIGNGGREHALGWDFKKDSDVELIFYAPGNGGTNSGRGVNINIDGTKKDNFPKLLEFTKKEGVDLVVVGPEAPLNDGIIDYFNSNGYFGIFGPTKNQTCIESDKFYSYDLMQKLGILQARSIKCSGLEDGLDAIDRFSGSVVLKHRWLAEGKGVRVYDSKNDARRDIKNFLNSFPGDFLVADRLYGEEFSFFGLVDGDIFLPINLAIQDHKRVNDGDKGLNTGGMGAYAPAPVASIEDLEHITNEIMSPVVKETGYKGFLYAGMMKSKTGDLKVIEFNCRLGDPETQAMVMMLENGLYRPVLNSIEGRLNPYYGIKIKNGASCCVVLTSQGYPGSYKKGLPINGILEAEALQEDTMVFHSGTKLNDKEEVITNGGRVLGVTSYSPLGIRNVKAKTYSAVNLIDNATPEVFHFRKDISDKALKYLGN